MSGPRRKACVHRYRLESPHGVTTRGVCRNCGRVRRFPSAFNGAGRALNSHAWGAIRRKGSQG